MMSNIILPMWQWIMENKIYLEVYCERLYASFF
jgi:hypothetical protein